VLPLSLTNLENEMTVLYYLFIYYYYYSIIIAGCSLLD